MPLHTRAYSQSEVDDDTILSGIVCNECQIYSLRHFVRISELLVSTFSASNGYRLISMSATTQLLIAAIVMLQKAHDSGWGG